MNTALIFAGGTGQRMNARARPKQFLELHGKPIMVYTLEHFDAHPEIDNILIVCIDDWIGELKHTLTRYGINKVTNIVPGGKNSFESIHNGLKALGDICENDDIVLIHDGVRPLISAELISENIAKAKEAGAAITVEAAIESVVCSLDGERVDSVPDRSAMYIAKAPQSFHYGLIRDLYQRAADDGIATIDSSHLCSIYKVNMHMVKSPPNNMKITAPADYYIFRALYEAMENQQILGI